MFFYRRFLSVAWVSCLFHCFSFYDKHGLYIHLAAGFEDEDWCLWAWVSFGFAQVCPHLIDAGVYLPANVCAHIHWLQDGAFFFAFETMTSIGYGTFTPKTNRSRWFIIFLAPIGNELE